MVLRPARQAWLRELEETARDRPGLETAPANLAGVRQMIRALRQGQTVGLLPDQVPPEGLGVWVPFFGQPAYTMTLAARLDRGVFTAWLEKNRPDVIFTLYHEVRRWLSELGRKVPADIGLIQYEWRADHADWAGMDQRNDLVGAAALDMLVTMVHHNDRGVPAHPKATMIGPHWVDGSTVMA